MAEDETLQESVLDGAETSATPAEAQYEPDQVNAIVTYTEADGRALMLMGFPRRLSIALVVLLPFAVIRSLPFAGGELPSWPSLGLLGLAGVFFAIYLLWIPRQVPKVNPAGQSWTISQQGVHITLPGADITHDWSRIDEVVLRPALIQFRIGKTSLVLPRRYLDESDTEVIKVLASGAHITVSTRGWLR